MSDLVPTPEPFSVLIVDSDRDAANALANYFRVATDLAVHVAYDAETCLADAARLMPNVIISEIDLPGKDGFTIARAMRCNLSTHTFLIALTKQRGLDERLFQAGFNRYFVKPASLLHMETAILLHELEIALAASAR